MINAGFIQPAFPIPQFFCGHAMQLFDIVVCLQHMLAHHSVLWYMYSPMGTGQIVPNQVTLFYQISHCRPKAIGDSPWTLPYSRPTGIVGRL
jgi:hypothetical protein